MTSFLSQLTTDNDMYLDGSNNLAYSGGIQAVLEDCQHAAQVRLGEMVLNAEGGIPYFESAFELPNPQAIRQALIAAWFTVPNVVDVPSLEVTIEGDKMRYIAVIQTTFGVGRFNG